MDARAVLSKQGWQGDGHPLRVGGLKRQILASHKVDLKGLGHGGRVVIDAGPAAGSHNDKSGGGAGWWADVFADKLKNITVGAAVRATSVTRGDLEDLVADRQVVADKTTTTGKKRNADKLALSLDRHFTHGGTLRSEDDRDKPTTMKGSEMQSETPVDAKAVADAVRAIVTEPLKKYRKRKRSDADDGRDAAAAPVKEYGDEEVKPKKQKQGRTKEDKIAEREARRRKIKEQKEERRIAKRERKLAKLAQEQTTTGTDKEQAMEASLAALSDAKLGVEAGKLKKEESRARAAARAEKKRRKLQRQQSKDAKRQKEIDTKSRVDPEKLKRQIKESRKYTKGKKGKLR